MISVETIEKVWAEVEGIFNRHKSAHLLMSGGKESVACAELLIALGYADRTTLVHVNTGAHLPIVESFIAQYIPFFKDYVELRSDQPAYIKLHGYPSDVVVQNHTSFGRTVCRDNEPCEMMCSKWECCSENVWKPVLDFIAFNPVEVMINGQRGADKTGGLSPVIRWGGKEVEQVFPLMDCTSEEVVEFLKTSPRCYLNGEFIKRFEADAGSSIDCWNCTAHWEDIPVRLAVLREFYPEHAVAYESLLRRISDDVERHSHGLSKVLGE